MLADTFVINDLEFQKQIFMKQLTFIIGVVLLGGIATNSFAQEKPNTGKKGNVENPIYRPHKCQSINKQVPAGYNASTTALTIQFPGNGQGGKVEIYRSGAKVVNATAPAGASLSYVLRNYGAGSYTIIVSSGKTVVYSNSVTVK